MPETSKAWFMLVAVTVITLFGFGGFGATPSPGKQTSDQQRSRAPDFSLTGIYGQKVQLASFRGKVVVLDFWATWCESCKAEIPRFIVLQKKYGSEGLQIIGISMDDDPYPVLEFYKRFRMNYPVAMADQKIGGLYGGVVGLPTTFLIGRDGRIYDRVPGAIVNLAHFREQIEALLAMKRRSSEITSKTKSIGLVSCYRLGEVPGCFKTTNFGPGERMGLQFRSEFFNLLSTPSLPVAVGKIDQAGSLCYEPFRTSIEITGGRWTRQVNAGGRQVIDA